MNSILEITLINAVMIVPLSLVAWGSGRIFRRPALTHLLWVIVLVKLVTPPVVQIPLIDREWLAATSRHLVPPVFTNPDQLFGFDPFEGLSRLKDPEQVQRRRNNLATQVVPPSRPRTLADQEKKNTARRGAFQTITDQWIRGEVLPQLIASCLLAVWAIGGMIWFSAQVFRCVRFRWLLKRGSPAGVELQQFADQFARQIGLARSPTVWLMPEVMSPMLWGDGHSTLLIFPKSLLERLDRESVGTLLTHELAHYRRQDHWVRMISLMVTGFYWWHPVVWWARREIESVEEECCDATVVKALSFPPKCYAQAILTTVDFLAEVQPGLPPLATGVSQFPFLRQRLTWIMRGPRRLEIGYLGRALCLLLACHLPMQPTWLAANHRKPSRKPDSSLKPTGSESIPDNKSPETDYDSVHHTGLAMLSKNLPAGMTAIPARWSGLNVRSHSHDRRFVVLADQTTQILLDMETGIDFDLSPFDITAIAFSPNTNQFVTIDGDRFLRLWNAESGDVVRTWQVPGGRSKSVDISTNARWIATGGRDGVIRIWSLTSHRPVKELPRELAAVNCVRFSPDGQLLAAATGDLVSAENGRIALFDVGPWTERISMNWNSPSAAIAFRADGATLTSGDWQGRIAKWDLETGELMGLLNVERDFLLADEFSPNGSPLSEIDIPDFDPNTDWSDPNPPREAPWFLDRWQPKSPASPAVQPKPPRSGE